MVYVLKITLDVRIYYYTTPFKGYFPTYLVNGIVSASPRTKSIGTWKKIRLEYRLYHQLCCHLNHTILQYRNAKWSFFRFAWLVDPASKYWRRSVCTGVQLFLNFLQKLYLPNNFLHIINAHIIHTRRTLI